MALLQNNKGWWTVVVAMWLLLLPLFLHAEPNRPASSVVAPPTKSTTIERVETVAVYVGSYTDVNSAEEMKKRLVALGYPAFLQATAVDQHRFVRVYGGPFQHDSPHVTKLLEVIHSRMGIRGVPVTGVVPPADEASAAAASSGGGAPSSTKTTPSTSTPASTSTAAVAVAPSTSAPAQTTVAVAAPATASGSEQFVVQLSSVANRTSLESWHAKLKAIGIASFQEDVQVDGRAFIRLLAGPFPNHGAARAAAEQIRSNFQIDGKVLRRAAGR
ncbi:MAG: SPOR domain-containing protein [Magnetococcales bacterium]|nr:SPOR domain-containing protein [Magnetococcales bacterium]